MGVRNTRGGNKSKGMARGRPKKAVAEKLENSNQMFGQVSFIGGNNLKIMCTDGIERKSGVPNYRKVKRLQKGDWVLIDTTDKEYCSILSLAKPSGDVVSLIKNDKEKDTENIIFSNINNEFEDLITGQNTMDFDQQIKTEENLKVSKKNDYGNFGLISDEEDEYNYEYEEEEVEVDKFGNTIEKKKEESTESQVEEEIIIQPSNLKKQKKSSNNQMVRISDSSNLDEDDPDLETL